MRVNIIRMCILHRRLLHLRPVRMDILTTQIIVLKIISIGPARANTVHRRGKCAERANRCVTNQLAERMVGAVGQ